MYILRSISSILYLIPVSRVAFDSGWRADVSHRNLTLEGTSMDEDLEHFTREQLVEEARKLRAGITRASR